ncbi:hypothetical protein COCNU_04G009940 [Cocos nucifera]|uniref:Uncharacterized protein n=1 Tax=Cocos nucifera TaxID=13894 RepID=A0A8K0N0I1_COCNU|nr:hypothetical protein COCNU_04G009940 [Cocos nucifera]
MNDENAAPPPKAVQQSSEYIASEDLKALPDPGTKIASLLEELESRDWLKVCEALNDVRRFARHHYSYLLPILNSETLANHSVCTEPLLTTKPWNDLSWLFTTWTRLDTVFFEITDSMEYDFILHQQIDLNCCSKALADMDVAGDERANLGIETSKGNLQKKFMHVGLLR